MSEKSNSKINQVLNVIHTRKSVRNFTGEGVSEREIELLLEAAMCAPTAVNTQPWSFVVVTEKKTLDALGEALPFAKMLHKAGAAIVVCGIPEKANLGKLSFAIIDSSLAAQNILLAAESMDLGAVWTAAYPYEDRMKPVRDILGIPEDVIPNCVIPLGQPTGEDIPKDKYNPENIHRERW